MRPRPARRRGRRARKSAADATSRCGPPCLLRACFAEGVSPTWIAGSSPPTRACAGWSRGEMKCAAFRGGTLGHFIWPQGAVNTAILIAAMSDRDRSGPENDAVQIPPTEHVEAGNTESCARVTPYSRFWNTNYDISCG